MQHKKFVNHYKKTGEIVYGNGCIKMCKIRCFKIAWKCLMIQKNAEFYVIDFEIQNAMLLLQLMWNEKKCFPNKWVSMKIKRLDLCLFQKKNREIRKRNFFRRSYRWV